MDSSQVIIEGFRYALRPFKVLITHETIEQVRTQPPQKLFAPLIGEENSIIAVERLAKYSKEHASRVRLFPGIKELLVELQSQGITCAVWSGRPTQGVVEILEANKVAHFFNHVVGSCKVSQNKPHPEGLLHVLDLMNLTANETVVVGDHLHDLQGSKAAGAYFVGAAWGTTPDSFKGHTPDQEFSSVKDFHKWVSSMSTGRIVESPVNLDAIGQVQMDL